MDSKATSIERVRGIAEQWFLSEPLLFAIWTTHRVIIQPNTTTIRTGRGCIEVNPGFLQTLDSRALREVMKFEAVRILLKHPYERKKTNRELAYEASNLAIQECMQTSLPMPRAIERFNSNQHDHLSFEQYYRILCGLPQTDRDTASKQPTDDSSEFPQTARAKQECDGAASGHKPLHEKEAESDRDRRGTEFDPEASTTGGSHECPPDLPQYCDPAFAAATNTAHWDHDTYYTEQINEIIAEVEASQCWGTLTGRTRERILATLRPKLDYRRVLRAFRATILSSQRQLTRMKPSRRYGFACLGSRREFCTKLLFAVDVSGSVSTQDIRTAFSAVNRFFQYGIETIDVIWFDRQIRNQRPLQLKRARTEIDVEGRGGTDFQPLMDYLDTHQQYDGLIIFTDGLAPAPLPPRRNTKTRITWLFNREENWSRIHKSLESNRMLTAFVIPQSS